MFVFAESGMSECVILFLELSFLKLLNYITNVMISSMWPMQISAFVDFDIKEKKNEK